MGNVSKNNDNNWYVGMKGHFILFPNPEVYRFQMLDFDAKIVSIEENLVIFHSRIFGEVVGNIEELYHQWIFTPTCAIGLKYPSVQYNKERKTYIALWVQDGIPQHYQCDSYKMALCQLKNHDNSEYQLQEVEEDVF